jgi:hypothetical protein
LFLRWAFLVEITKSGIFKIVSGSISRISNNWL